MPHWRERTLALVTSRPPSATRPRIGPQEAGDEPQQRRLAAAGRPDADDELARLRSRASTSNDARVAAGIAEAHPVEATAGRPFTARSCDRGFAPGRPAVIRPLRGRQPRRAARRQRAGDRRGEREGEQHDGRGAGEAGGAVERLQQHDRVGAVEEARDQVRELELADRQRGDDDEPARASSGAAPAARCGRSAAGRCCPATRRRPRARAGRGAACPRRPSAGNRAGRARCGRRSAARRCRATAARPTRTPG